MIHSLYILVVLNPFIYEEMNNYGTNELMNHYIKTRARNKYFNLKDSVNFPKKIAPMDKIFIMISKIWQFIFFQSKLMSELMNKNMLHMKRR